MAVKKKKPVAKNTASRDLFTCGYAAALAAVIRMYDQPTIVRNVMSGDGLTLKDFKKAGVEEFDLDILRKAL